MIALYWLGALYVLWPLYLAVMNLKRARDAGTLSRTAYVLGAPLLYGGWALDIVLNLVVFTLILMELPRWKEWTITARLKRHVKELTWRGNVARWFGANLLDPFDPSGRHL